MTQRLLTVNGVLAGLGLLAWFGALVLEVFPDANHTSAAFMLGGLAFIPLLWVLVTSLAALRGKVDEPRALLERQATLVVAALIIMTLARLVWLLGPRPAEIGWVHYLVGVQTLLVYYSGRLHALSQHPPLARLHPMAAVGVGASILIEVGVVVRLLAPA